MQCSRFSSILRRNAYMATVKCCQFDQILSLRFVYVHNLEISLRISTEEQIVTVSVGRFIRVLLWFFLRPLLRVNCCVLRNENIHPPMDESSILPVIKNHDSKNIYNFSFIPLIPSLQAGLEKMYFAYGCKCFGRLNSGLRLQ